MITFRARTFDLIGGGGGRKKNVQRESGRQKLRRERAEESTSEGCALSYIHTHTYPVF